MADIQAREYIRTKDGIIDKVVIDYTGKCNNPNCNRKHISCKSNYYNEEDIVNIQKNRIDLIEINDMVSLNNMERVFKVIKIDEKRIYGAYESFGKEALLQDYNVSIVTKEQFASVEYKVESED